MKNSFAAYLHHYHYMSFRQLKPTLNHIKNFIEVFTRYYLTLVLISFKDGVVKVVKLKFIFYSYVVRK